MDDRSGRDKAIGGLAAEMLKTDYIDFGFLHCLDEEEDLEDIADSGVLEYMQQLKKEGTIRHIALSTHTPQLAERVLDMEIIDLLMFSINPGYDYHHGDYASAEQMKGQRFTAGVKRKVWGSPS